MDKRSEDFKKVYEMLKDIIIEHASTFTKEDQLQLLTSMYLIEEFIIPDSKELH